MFKYLAAASLVFLIGATAAEFVVLEQRNDPPAGFSSVGPAPADQILSLHLALTQSDIVGLQDTVYEISTPGNPRYGQYLTEDEVKQFVAPSADTASLVNGWLASNELTAAPASPAGDWISVNMTVSQANDLLAAEFLTFRNDGTSQTVVRTLSYSVPRALKTGIEWVHPTIIFPEASNGGFPSFINKTSSGTTGGRSVTPESVSPDCRATSSWSPVCLQELYGIPSAPAKPAKNMFWVSGFDNDFANKHDLQAFLETFRPDMNPNTTFDFVSVDGGINNQLPAGGGIEANPDMQYAVGLTNGIPITFISTGTLPNDRLTEMLDQANYLLSLEHPPNTVLNTQTPGLESQLSPQMAVSICNAYAQLAARGVSYIVQTNLWGAGSVPLPGCKPFDAPFPASCPFVTAVGATQFDDDQTEENASEFSGGGFSNFFRRPKYQDTAVAAYLRATNNTHATAFNVSGRAVPDVSAVWFVPWIFDLGVVDFLSAVGYSATIFASTVALLTNERIAAGKPGLGFLNPLIYANPGAFNDMKTGSNPGCAGAAIGFNSTSGWDPVTGFGSPSYPKLHEICSKL